MGPHRAECTDCSWEFEDYDPVVVGDAVEAREREDHHDVEVGQAVARDGGPGSAVDHGFEEHPTDTRTILDENLAGIKRAPDPGYVAIDLVTRKIVYVDCIVAGTVQQYFEEESVDLRSYKTHPYLPVKLDDTVYGVVYVEPSVEGIHNAGDVYPMPRGRLARIPVEQATPKWRAD